jgi:hypothetical protein
LESAHLESPANLGIILELAIALSNIKGEENAWLLYRFGGQVEAEKILQNVLRAGQISSESSYFAARILMNKNRAASKRLFEELIKNGRQFLGFNEAKTIYKTIIW